MITGDVYKRQLNMCEETTSSIKETTNFNMHSESNQRYFKKQICFSFIISYTMENLYKVLLTAHVRWRCDMCDKETKVSFQVSQQYES